MRGLIPGIAVLLVAVPLAPAQAFDPPSMGSGNAATFVGGDGDHGRWDRRDQRRHRDSRGPVIVTDWGSRGWDGGSAWRSDSFNDWWHDRPDRAFPRWTQTNQNCERIWWSGSGWRC